MQLVSKSSWLSKFIAIAISIAMVLSFSSVGTALAAGDDTQDTPTASITIENAVSGVKYYAYKLFDATTNGTTDDDITAIAYKTIAKYDIPTDLSTYFSADAQGNVTPTEDAISSSSKSSDNYEKGNTPQASKELVQALTSWASNLGKEKADYTATGNNNGLAEFINLPYGYYVIISETESATASQVTVTSSYPDRKVSIKDMTVPATDFNKTVSSENVSIGDDITYTITFTASNYYKTDNGLEEITNYKITDKLPTSVSAITDNGTFGVSYINDNLTEAQSITSNAVIKEETEEPTDGEPEESAAEDANSEEIQDEITNTATFTFDGQDLTIEIPWNKNMTSPSTVTVTYKAKVNSNIISNSEDENTNNAHISWTNSKSSDESDGDVVIKTSAIAIQKVNEKGEQLKGAKFSVKGLVVEDDNTENGVYTVKSYNADSDDYSTALSCNDNGVLVILGIEPSGTTTSADGTTISSTSKLTVQEEEAPNGYNKMVGTKDIEVTPLNSSAPSAASEDSETPTITAFEKVTKYADALNITTSEIKDAETNVTTYESKESNYGIHVLTVMNSKGTILPSTGGMGTTILYVIGGLLIVCAGGALYIRRRNQA
jgi:LPXTG-motif cell wall-anchored protein/uncharacterized repeat protein (TIGR01451 family)